MVERWTNQLNLSAQTEVMSLLPQTTGSPSLNKGHLHDQVKHFFYNHNLQSVFNVLLAVFFPCRGMFANEKKTVTHSQ